jgi:hypothetical protein
MKRTTISRPEDLAKRLRLLAAKRRTSVAALIREAIDEASARYRPKPKSLGIGDSGVGSAMAPTIPMPRPRPRGFWPTMRP